MLEIGGGTRLAGVVGWPVAHSRSPALHNRWLRQNGVDGAYVPLPVAPGRLQTALRGLQAAGFAGVNVTLPHKEEAYRLSDVASPAAHRCQAVNTLVFDTDGQLHGDSTDGQGFVDSLRAAGIDPAAGPALVLGAGGAARAVAAVLQDLGVAVWIANRGAARAERLAASLNETARPGAPPIRVTDWETRADLPGRPALLVNTTAIGMAGSPGTPCDLEHAPHGLVVCDIVYTPRRTRLLAEAEIRGLRTVEGIGMLLHQARIGHAAWFGVLPAIDPDLADAVAGEA